MSCLDGCLHSTECPSSFSIDFYDKKTENKRMQFSESVEYMILIRFIILMACLQLRHFKHFLLCTLFANFADNKM